MKRATDPGTGDSDMRRTAAAGLLATILFTGSILGCKSSVHQKDYGPPDASCRILITGSTSEFKEAVVAGLVKRYQGTCRIVIRPMFRLDEGEFDEYDVIILMDECQAWMAFNTKTLGLIKKIENKDHIILFITAGDPDWTFSTQGIDAITSASEMVRKDEVIERISARIDALIG
jgi:hypothetical protein